MRAGCKGSAPILCSTSVCGSAKVRGAALAWPLLDSGLPRAARDGELRIGRCERAGALSLQALRQELRMFFIALQFLTRVPVPAWVGEGFQPSWLNRCVVHFPPGRRAGWCGRRGGARGRQHPALAARGGAARGDGHRLADRRVSRRRLGRYLRRTRRLRTARACAGDHEGLAHRHVRRGGARVVARAARGAAGRTRSHGGLRTSMPRRGRWSPRICWAARGRWC